MIDKGTGSWICWNCIDYNLDTDFNCAYCGQRQDAFSQWLHAVDVELADRGEKRDGLAYQLWQWWEMCDHNAEPDVAVIAALIFRPEETKPWPEHLVYTTKYYPTWINERNLV